MVFKPPLDFPTIVGGETFPNAFAHPTTIIRNIQASPQWWTNNSQADAVGLAETIVQHYAGAILQTVASSRQQRQIFDQQQQRTRRCVPALWIEITFNSGQETLYLTVFPENAPSLGGPHSISAGGVFDVKVPFTGYPLPSMGAKGGTTWADVYTLLGVGAYPFDSAWAPNNPGPKMVQDKTTGLWKCDTPTTTPDLADQTSTNISNLGPITGVTGLLNELMALNPAYLLGEGYALFANASIPVYSIGGGADQGGMGSIVYGNTGHYGVPEAYWCEGVAGNAILTQPLSGKQYWEVEIVKAPVGKVPDNFLILGSSPPQYGAWNPKLDSFGTPLIGVCPGYYLPDDQTPADPTAAPKKFQDYMRPLGCDPLLDPAGPKSKLARSVYLARVARDADRSTNPISYVWMVGSWVVGSVPNLIAYRAALLAWDGIPGTKPLLSTDTAGGWLADDNPYVTQRESVYSFLPPPPLTTVPADIAYYNHGWFATDGILWYAGDAGTKTWNADLPGWVCDPLPGGNPSMKVPPWLELYGPGVGPPSSLYVGNDTTLTGNQQFWDISYGSAVDVYLGPASINVYGYKNGDMMSYAGLAGVAYAVGAAPVPVAYLPGFKYALTPQTFLASVDGDFLTDSQPPSGSSYTDPTFPVDTSAEIQFIQDLDRAGYHSPVYIGRADDLATQHNYSGSGSDVKLGDGSALPLDGSLKQATQTMGCIGQLTGVDLGDLKNGDVVMIATDTATGYIWFGKNGVWYAAATNGVGSSEALTSNAGPSQGTRWTAVMDGFPKSATPIATPNGAYDPATFPPQYFPAVGWRIGAMELKIHYGVGMKYSPPKGFKIYGGGSTVTY